MACEPPQNAAMLAGEVKAAQTCSGSAGRWRLAISSSPRSSALGSTDRSVVGEVLFEGVEPVVPGAALVVDPRAEQRQLIGPQPAGAPGALAPLLDQAAPPQDTDVVGDRLWGQVERFSELSHRGVTLRETSHQGATDGSPRAAKAESRSGPGAASEEGMASRTQTVICASPFAHHVTTAPEPSTRTRVRFPSSVPVTEREFAVRPHRIRSPFQLPSAAPEEGPLRGVVGDGDGGVERRAVLGRVGRAGREELGAGDVLGVVRRRARAARRSARATAGPSSSASATARLSATTGDGFDAVQLVVERDDLRQSVSAHARCVGVHRVDRGEQLVAARRGCVAGTRARARGPRRSAPGPTRAVLVASSTSSPVGAARRVRRASVSSSSASRPMTSGSAGISATQDAARAGSLRRRTPRGPGSSSPERGSPR